MDQNILKKEFYKMIHKDEQLLDALLSASVEGFLFFDLLDLESAWLSSKYWELLGYNPNDMEHLEYAWKDTIFEEDLRIAIEELTKHCEESNYLFDRLLRHKHKSGSIIWMRFRGVVIKDEYSKATSLLGSFSNVSGYIKMEQEILRLAEEYENIFNGTRDAMFLMEVLGDYEFRYIKNNYAHQIKTKLSIDDISKKTPQELLGKELGDFVSNNYQKCVESKKSISYEEKLNLPGGEIFWLTTLTPILEDDQVVKIIGSATDITDQKILELKLEKYANYDKLTDLPNRRLFFDRLERLICESERDVTQFALLFIDLDGFKEINDEYGHEAGDEVLITIGKRLLKRVRISDTVARMGGDEFAILIRNIKDKKDARNIVEKIHKIFQEVIQIKNNECKVNSSIGVAIYPNHGNDSESLLKKADSIMYEIKKNRKGGFGFYKN